MTKAVSEVVIRICPNWWLKMAVWKLPKAAKK